MPVRTPRASRLRAPTLPRTCYFDALESRILFSFGLTSTSSTYTVDTGANLVFTVSRSTANSGSIGDLMTMTFNGTNLAAPFATSSRYSHYESGLGSATVVTAAVDPAGQWIKIACDDTSGVGVIQYYIAHKGDPTIYMATYAPGPGSPSPGEMRFITYTSPTVLTNIPAPSNNNGSTGAIESSDVFGHPDGTTSSNYYGEYRAIDTQTYGMTGGAFGVFMNIGNRETSSGGPFYKDIDFQNNELYTYTFSGHSQTENFRAGLKGPYALQFTTGAVPAPPDYSFISALNLTGYIGASGRGTLTGTATGVPSALPATVALSNAADQYWATPDASGNYTLPNVVAGTYTETLYQGELAIGTVQVTIAAGKTTRQNIVNTQNYYEMSSSSTAITTPAVTNAIWTIGTWDGTPLGFLNADKISNMHPTDVRMSPWAADATGVTNFTVGTDPVSSFPMAEWHNQVGTGPAGTSSPYVDTDNRITFTLTAAQAATPLTLRIGLTRLDSARPNISINGHSSSIQTIASQPNSRGLTTGNWRGNNCVYIFNLSTTNLIAGTNTLDISSVSGSTGTYYAGYHIYDAIDLVPTSSLTNAPVVTTILLTPPNPTLSRNQQQQFSAQAKDQFGNPLPANFSWSATTGTVDGTGLYTAPSTSGSDTVTATSGAIHGSANVTIPNAAPTIATPASASPNPVLSPTTTLSILGADDGGESNLTYSWSATGPAPVTYSDNATNAAKTATATFTLSGSYTLTCTITDAGGKSVTSNTTLSVLPGDANQDGTINSADLTIILNNFGKLTSAWTDGNFDGQPTINLTDMAYVLNYMGDSLTPPPPAVTTTTGVTTQTTTAPTPITPAAPTLPATSQSTPALPIATTADTFPALPLVTPTIPSTAIPPAPPQPAPAHHPAPKPKPVAKPATKQNTPRLLPFLNFHYRR